MKEILHKCFGLSINLTNKFIIMNNNCKLTRRSSKKMPPRGFSKKAINGLLTYIQEVYKALGQLEGHNEKEQLVKALKLLKKHHTTINSSAIPFPINNQGIEGLNTFITSCVEDLDEEINKGKDKHSREVRKNYAINKEIEEIGNYLEKFTI